jgi:hypothetical protein
LPFCAECTERSEQALIQTVQAVSLFGILSFAFYSFLWYHLFCYIFLFTLPLPTVCHVGGGSFLFSRQLALQMYQRCETYTAVDAVPLLDCTNTTPVIHCDLLQRDEVFVEMVPQTFNRQTFLFVFSCHLLPLSPLL